MTEAFDDLFVDKEELNEEILKEILSGRVRLTPETEVLLVEKESPRATVLLHLLAQKIFVLKKMVSEEGIGGKELHAGTGIPLLFPGWVK